MSKLRDVKISNVEYLDLTVIQLDCYLFPLELSQFVQNFKNRRYCKTQSDLD